MELTPIKIPCKRTRDNSKQAVEERKLLNRPRGRPLKLISSRDKEAKINEIVKKEPTKLKQRTLKNIKSRYKMSNLEKLPLELLEAVHLYAMNIALPKSSPVIGGKLSSRRILLQTLVSAFGPTWEGWQGVSMEESWGSRNKSDAELQSAILRCRWATFDVIIEAKEAWVQKYTVNQKLKLSWFSRPSQANEEDENDPNTDESDAGVETEENPLYNAVSVPDETTIKDYFNKGFTLFSEFCKQEDPNRPVKFIETRDVEGGVEIPESLLLGPWNEEQTKCLFWLVNAGARLNWLTSTSGEVALMGLQKAIELGDTRAISLLCWSGISSRLDAETIIWALHNAGGNKIRVMNHLFYCARGVQFGCEEVWEAIQDMKSEGYMRHDRQAKVVDQEKIDYTTAIQKSRHFRCFILGTPRKIL